MRLLISCRMIKALACRMEGCCLVKLQHPGGKCTVVFLDDVPVPRSFCPQRVVNDTSCTLPPVLFVVWGSRWTEPFPEAIEVRSRIKDVLLEQLVQLVQKDTGPGSGAPRPAVELRHIGVHGVGRARHCTVAECVYVSSASMKKICRLIKDRRFGEQEFLHYKVVLEFSYVFKVCVTATVVIDYCKEYARGPRDNNDYEAVLRLHGCRIDRLTILQ